MVNFKGYEVEIEIDGEVLEEYQPPDDPLGESTEDGVPTITRYIQVEEGKAFTVATRVGEQAAWTDDAKCFGYFIDGDCVSTAIESKTEWNVNRAARHLESAAKWVDNGVTMSRDFVIERLETNEEHTSKEILQKFVRSLGEIRVVVEDGAYSSAATPYATDPSQLDNDLKVPEKALKGRHMDTRATLGASKVTTASTWAYMDNTKKVAIFVFKYRSKKGLQAIDILETTPEPAREPTPPPPPTIDTMSEEELRAYARQLESEVTIRKGSSASTIKREKETDVKRFHVDSDDEECTIIERKKVKTGPVSASEKLKQELVAAAPQIQIILKALNNAEKARTKEEKQLHAKLRGMYDSHLVSSGIMADLLM
ncbi:hypothetical protein LTR66_015695, partial [Elasticomyces elasticus]